jgi:hypothetical protein
MGRSKKTTTSRREIAPYVERGSEQAITRAREIADRPYVEYGGERIAGMDPSEQRAYGLAEEGVGAYERDLGRSREFAEQAAQPFTDFDQEAYMNPYIKGALDPAARELREEMARQQQEIGGQAGMTGAFGGSRQAILESEARRGGTEAIGDLYGRGYSQAFESARDQINRDRAASRAAADQFRATGAQGQQQMTQDIQNLLTTGGLQRNLRQAGLDFDYKQFVEARDWDITNLQPLLAALSTVPYSETQTNTTKSKKSALATVVGLATTAYGAYTANPGMMAAGMEGASGGGGGGGGSPAGISPTGGGYQGIPGFGGAQVGPYSNQSGTMPGMSWPQAGATPQFDYSGGVF